MTEKKIEVTSKTKKEFDEDKQDNQVVYKDLNHFVAHAAKLKSAATGGYSTNPWTASDVDKFASPNPTKEYREVVKSCRFFYRRDPIASIVINKLIEIAVTDILLIQGKVPINQFRIYESVLDEIQDFVEDCALEYLVSGLLIPEVDFVQMPKREVELRGIKAYNSLSLPEAYWIRDPEVIIINSPLIANKPSYYVEIPEELSTFIRNEGKYADGTEDKELYLEILKLYPELVRAVLKNELKVPLDNNLIFRRRYMADSPYPTPYLFPALESLRHKRNIRRMDYSVASRVISAIQQIKVGDKDFPLVAEDDTQLDDLRYQMRWRDSNQKDIERIFQLFTNHTVEILWVAPDTRTLLDDVKYKSVNSDILYALGLPKILMTGETERSQSSDASVALISPEKTMKSLQRRLIKVVRDIIFSITDNNNFKTSPEVRFAPMNLKSFSEFLSGLEFLYTSGNISRTTIDKELGYEFDEQAQEIAEENKLIEGLGIPEFAPIPHSNSPTQGTEEEKDSESPDNSGEKE